MSRSGYFGVTQSSSPRCRHGLTQRFTPTILDARSRIRALTDSAFTTCSKRCELRLRRVRKCRADDLRRLCRPSGRSPDRPLKDLKVASTAFFDLFGETSRGEALRCCGTEIWLGYAPLLHLIHCSKVVLHRNRTSDRQDSG